VLKAEVLKAESGKPKAEECYGVVLLSAFRFLLSDFLRGRTKRTGLEKSPSFKDGLVREAVPSTLA